MTEKVLLPDFYAVYNNHVYRANVEGDNQVRIMTRDKNLADGTFKEKTSFDGNILYKKVVSMQELQRLFRRRYEGIYRGYRFDVQRINLSAGTLSFTSNNHEIREVLELEHVDKLLYGLDNVPLGEVELIPIDKELLG